MEKKNRYQCEKGNHEGELQNADTFAVVTGNPPVDKPDQEDFSETRLPEDFVLGIKRAGQTGQPMVSAVHVSMIKKKKKKR